MEKHDIAADIVRQKNKLNELYATVASLEYSIESKYEIDNRVRVSRGSFYKDLESILTLPEVKEVEKVILSKVKEILQKRQTEYDSFIISKTI